MIFTLVITLSIGVLEKPQLSDIACNRAQVEAQAQAARDYPQARFIRAECRRERA